MYFALAVPTVFLCAVCSVDLWYAKTKTWKEMVIKILMANVLIVQVLLMISISYNSWFFSHHYETSLDDTWCSSIVTDCYFTSQLELTSLVINLIFLYGNFCDMLGKPGRHIHSAPIALFGILLLTFLVANVFNYTVVQFVKDDCFSVLPEPWFIGNIGMTWAAVILYLISFCFFCCFLTSYIEESGAVSRSFDSTLIIAFYFMGMTTDVVSQLHAAFSNVPNSIFQESLMDLTYFHIGLLLPVTVVPVTMIVLLQPLRSRFPLRYIDYLTLEEQEKELNELSNLE